MAIKDIRPALRALLLSDAAVSTAVGGDRVFPTRMPQTETRASLVYFRVSEFDSFVMVGPTALVRVRMQIDAWASNPGVAADLADKVKDKINGYRGSPGSPAVEIQGIFCQNLSQEDFDAESKLYRTGRDYLIAYMEE